MGEGSEESHWNHVQMLITTQAGNLLLKFLFNLTESYWNYFNTSIAECKLWISAFSTNHYMPQFNHIHLCLGVTIAEKEQWCVESDALAHRGAVYSKWSCAFDSRPAATSIWAEEDHSEEPTPPGPSRRWRREYHALLVSCKGNYCWLKLLNICLLAPQSTL